MRRKKKKKKSQNKWRRNLRESKRMKLWMRLICILKWKAESMLELIMKLNHLRLKW
jgi:hypothetical protein